MTDEKILELLKNHPTPFYVFDLGELRSRVKYLKSALPEKVELCYAVKANTFIAKAASECVDLLEICSPGEYRICEKFGIPHGMYVVSGVNKQADFIEDSIASEDPVGYYTAESVSQFHLLRNGAEKAQRRITALLRLTSGNQFGLDKEDLMAIVRDYKDDPWIDICGIQYFSGTQKNSLKKLKRELDYVDQFIADLRAEYGFETRKLEYGTGFPVAYFEGETFEEDAFLAEFSSLLTGMAFEGKIALEVGRSIAASCGTYLTSVVDTKRNCGENYAIVDGGMHQIVYYGQFMAMKHPKIRLFAQGAETSSGAETQDWNICGSLCTINDFLVKKLPLPGLDIGDILVFERAGAYCPTEGISLFLSRELPRVILLGANGQETVAREHIETAQFNMPKS
ncbi:MAG: alanine racemase [Clostridiales bacterium]|nr:alanine racemase [Clostridiales bacterium]